MHIQLGYKSFWSCKLKTSVTKQQWVCMNHTHSWLGAIIGLTSTAKRTAFNFCAIASIPIYNAPQLTLNCKVFQSEWKWRCEGVWPSANWVLVFKRLMIPTMCLILQPSECRSLHFLSLDSMVHFHMRDFPAKHPDRTNFLFLEST